MRERAATIALIGGYLAATASILLFWTTTLEAASVSVYEAQPLGWTLVVISMVLATVGLLTAERRRNRFASVLLLVIGIAISVGAPYFMGAFQSQASDPLVHTVFIEDLKQTGAIDVLPYLTVHLAVSALSSATGLTIPVLVAWFPALSKVFSLIAIVYLVSSFDFVPTDRRWIAAAWAAPFIGGIFEVSFYPENMAIHFGILLLAIALRYEKNPSPPYGIALFLASLGILMMHPRMSAYVFGVIIVIYLIKSGFDLGKKHLAVVLTLAILWGYWSSLLQPTGGIVSRLASLFGGTTATFSGNVAQAAGIGTEGLVRFALMNFAALIILGVAALTGFIAILLRPRLSSAKRPILAGIFVGVLALGAPIFIGRQALSRAVQASLFLLFLPILAYLGLHIAKNRRTVALLFLLALLAISSVTSHRSPLMLQSSWHVDNQSVSFANWMGEHTEGRFLTAGFHPVLAQFGDIGTTSADGGGDKLILRDSTGAFERNGGASVWMAEGDGILLHSRIEARCEHSTLKHGLIEGRLFLHREDFCLLDKNSLGARGDVIFDSNAAVLIRSSNAG